ncbi:MAG TPA: hypothetical protein VMV92_37335 [Streptosporangiaceae bacterium]|nr:hypothetical protein [Streptosporangiaceae bacterium]
MSAGGKAAGSAVAAGLILAAMGGHGVKLGHLGSDLTTAAHHLGGGTISGNAPVGARKAYLALRRAGLSRHAALILTAIGGVESNWNTRALNNDPATGDYSVGVWQVNYFGSLDGPRTAEFGSPARLSGRLRRQAHAVFVLYGQAGFGPWEPDITSGKISAYMAQAEAAAR